MTEWALRRAMVELGRELGRAGLIVAREGNLSVRLEAGRFLVTPSGARKDRLEPAELVIVGLAGQSLAARTGPGPSTEWPLHRTFYAARAEVGAIIHAHPVHAVALSVAGLPFPERILPEAYHVLGDVPTAEFARPGTEEMARVLAPHVGARAVILAQHGAVAVGASLDEAYERLATLEHAAQIAILAHGLGHVNMIPPERL